MIRTACIVQARLGSTRLPAKVLLPLPTGRTVLQEVLFRCAQIRGIDKVVLAIPDTPENDILLSHCALHLGLHEIVRGPEHDVLARYVKAAEAVEADVIMRITADCPLIDPEVCGAMLASLKAERFDYMSNSWPQRSFPHGLDCEVFHYRVLHEANLMAIEPHQREHVTPWMQRIDPRIKNAGYSSWALMREPDPHTRWTLDTLEDYVRIWGIFEQQMRDAA